MSLSQRLSRRRGFSLLELMVVVAIIAIAIALAVPYFGGAAATARQRGSVDQMISDFNWARAAAGVSDASTLGVGAPVGIPTVTITLNNQAAGGCSWTTKIAVGTAAPIVDGKHSSPAAAGVTCGVATDTLVLPVTFTFDAQGYITQTGTISYSSTQAGSTGVTFWPLMFLSSGAIIKTNAAS